MIILKEIIDYFSKIAPLSYQASYDNSGLQIGNINKSIYKILTCLDVTLDTLKEAKAKKCNLIVSHHPLIFKELKNITGKNWVEECIIFAIHNDISIYSIHTNLDNVNKGVSFKLAEILGLQNIKILRGKKRVLSKLTTFVPKEYHDKVKEALFKSGSGFVGNYSECSFSTQGEGTYLPNKSSKPFIGEQETFQEINEKRLEVTFPTYLSNKIIDSLYHSHPYEEPVYHLHNLENTSKEVGSGAIGELVEKMSPKDFIEYIKQRLQIKFLKHSALVENGIKKVALCGGSGSFLMKDATNHKVDAFLTGDIKYHDFFEVQNHSLLVDIGHYESEIHTKRLLSKILSNKFANIAVVECETITNPIYYS